MDTKLLDATYLLRDALPRSKPGRSASRLTCAGSFSLLGCLNSTTLVHPEDQRGDTQSSQTDIAEDTNVHGNGSMRRLHPVGEGADPGGDVMEERQDYHGTSIRLLGLFQGRRREQRS